MPDTLPQASLRAVYLGYRSVLAVGSGSDLRGRLVLLTGEPGSGSVRAAGARIAGAAVLLALADAGAAKDAVRAGHCDYLVNTLDEALRILKNEIRRGAAVGVCLHADPLDVVRVCVERGVQPDLMDGTDEALQDRGALLVAWKREFDSGESWVCWEVAAARGRELSAVDDLAGGSILERGAEKTRWLRSAPEMLGRTWAGRRALPMTAKERVEFVRRLERSSAAAELELTVECDGPRGWPRGAM